MIVPILNKDYVIIDKGYKTPCHVWVKARTKGGYARAGYTVSYKKKVFVLVHRFLYEEKYGKLPPKLQIDHLCNTRSCINIEHLEAVTNGENQRRGFERGTKFPTGKCLYKGL